MPPTPVSKGTFRWEYVCRPFFQAHQGCMPTAAAFWPEKMGSGPQGRYSGPQGFILAGKGYILAHRGHSCPLRQHSGPQWLYSDLQGLRTSNAHLHDVHGKWTSHFRQRAMVSSGPKRMAPTGPKWMEIQSSRSNKKNVFPIDCTSDRGIVFAGYWYVLSGCMGIGLGCAGQIISLSPPLSPSSSPKGCPTL